MTITKLALRSRNIAEVLARNGLSALAYQAGLNKWLPAKYRHQADESLHPADLTPETLVKTFQELGATFIKLGQTLAMRPDLLPASYISALESLTDQAKPVDTAIICQEIELGLGVPSHEVFSRFEVEPLGVASVGQVHGAVLQQGQDVVVKVRKPGVREDVESDLALLRTLARTLERSNKSFRTLGLSSIVAEFATTLQEELDFTHEAANCQQMAALFEDDPQIHIPAIDQESTASNVLVQERIRGIRMDDIPALTAAGIDPAKVASLYAHALMRQVFEFGVFHADPHAGNVFVLSDGSLTFIDWGMTGRLSSDMRRKLVALLVSFSLKNKDLVLSSLIDIAPPRGSLNRAKLRSDIADLMVYIDSGSLEELDVSQILEQAIALIRRHGLALPADISVLLRMLVLSEGLVRNLNHDISVFEIADRQARQMIRDAFRPEQLIGNIKEQSMSLAVFAKDLPPRINRILERAENGEMDVNVRGDAIEGSMRSLNRITNRLVGGLLTSAGVIAGALIYSASQRR